MNHGWVPLFWTPCGATVQHARPGSPIARVMSRAWKTSAIKTRRRQQHQQHQQRRQPDGVQSIGMISTLRRLRDTCWHNEQAIKDGRPKQRSERVNDSSVVDRKQAWLFRLLREKIKRDSSEPPALDGPAFRSRELSQAEIDRIFGPGIDVDYGNRLLRFLHGQRLEGFLDSDPAEVPLELAAKLKERGLAWLRQRYPVDERAAYQARLAKDEALLQEVIVADAERIGLYRPNANVKPGEEYGKAAIDEMQDEWRRRAETRKKQEEERKLKVAQEGSRSLELMKHNNELSQYSIRVIPMLFVVNRSRVLIHQPMVQNEWRIGNG